VVTGYVPAAQAAPSVAVATTFADPRSGRAIAIEAAGHHLRIETMDPRWAQQRAVADARRATAHDTLAGGDEVADNLRRLAAARGDVFRGEAQGGEKGEPAAKRLKQ